MLLFIVAFITAVVVVNYSSTYYKAFARGEGAREGHVL
jgi:hypothetical protein